MKTSDFEWAVIGAGPAGIAAVGKLLDSGVHPKSLVWVDPHFLVGDFGAKWQNVPSNTKVNLFLKFLNECKAFRYSECKEDFELNHTPPEDNCFLRLMAAPLQWVSNHLMQNVVTVKNVVETLKMHNHRWNWQCGNEKLSAKNVVLAIGSEPKSLTYPGVEPIPVDIAMDRELLTKHCGPEDRVAVFGSSHSAILILRSLLESCNVKNVVNFYRAPLRYAVYLENEILFDDTGLKGSTAAWARENLHGTLPPKLEHIYSSTENVQHHLPHCNKAIYAVGFERRVMDIDGLGKLEYNPYNGIIAPGLFGLGIAFPQAKLDRFGNLEYRVGLWKFMDYLSTILPIWMRYPI